MRHVPGEKKLRVLFAPETFNLGETSRAVEVAQAMRREGHDVLFMGYSHQFAPYVREAGFDCELLSPELTDDDAAQLLAADQGRSLRHPFTTPVVRQRVRSELDLMQRWNPDVVVIGSTLTMFISARVAGIPLVYIKPYPLSRGHLMLMKELPVLTRSGAPAALVNRGAGWAAHRLAASVRWKPTSFRRVAAEHGLGLPTLTLEAMDGDLNLIASLFPALDGRRLMDTEEAVGPIYARSSQALPPQVQELAHRTRPAVYVGLGSSANRSLALALLEQLAPMSIDIVSTAGRYLTSADRRSFPDSVGIYDFLPAHRLTGLIDASVIHGGEGTVQTACASGAPFAGIALQSEQRFNLDECVQYGNALRFTAADLRRRQVPDLVNRLLRDPDLRQSASALREKVSRLDGAQTSARLIAELVSEQRRSGP